MVLDDISRDLNDLLTGAFDLLVKVEQSTFRDTKYNDLTVVEIHTIAAIGDRERSMGEVAGKLGVTLATLNASIGRLTAKGYVERRRTEADRRLVLVKLTRPGRVVRRLHENFHEKMMARSLQDLSPAEREILSRALGKIRLFFEEVTRKPPEEEEEQPWACD